MGSMYSWIDVLMTAVSSGTLCSVLGWWVNRKLRRAKSAKEIQDVYKTMYENLELTILKFQDENQKLYRAVARLEKAVTRATTCPHYADCPIRDELHEQQANDALRKAGQHRNKRSAKRDVHSRPSQQCDTPAEPQ